MITVYFETPNNSYAEKVAMFADSELYNACLPMLESMAEKARMIVTESYDEEEV